MASPLEEAIARGGYRPRNPTSVMDTYHPQLPAYAAEEEGLGGVVPTENITGLGLSPLDLIGLGLPAKIALGAKAAGGALAAALGATAIGSRASQGARLSPLAEALSGQRGVTAGVPFTFIRNTEKAPKVTGYGQDIEPSGRYMLEDTGNVASSLPLKWESGEHKFENPLFIDWGGEYGSSSNWKNMLSEKFGGKTGSSLSKAIHKAGYDAVVTKYPSGETSEIVDLTHLGKLKSPESTGEILHPERAKTEFELAHEVAQRNAALPVEQGGLGLPPDNTAMDRARALGYPMDMYGKPHSNMAFTRASTNAPMKKAEVIKAELEQLGIPVRGEQAASGSTYLDIPGNPYKVDERYGGGQSVPIEQMRFSTHSKREYGKPINEPDSSFLADVFPKYGNTTDDARQAIQDMIARGGIRSRFAAFDPMQRNSANILAGTAAGGLGLGAMLPEEPQGYAEGGLAQGLGTPSGNPVGRYIQGVASRTLHPLESMAEAATHYASMPVDELMNAALPRSGAIQSVADDSMIRLIAEKYKLPWHEAAQEYFAKGTRVTPGNKVIPEVQPSQHYALGGLVNGYHTLPNTATVNKPSYAGLSGLRAGMTLNPAASNIRIMPTHTPLRAHLAMV